MAEQARVTSIEALEAFRAHLIVFLGKSRRAIDETGDEIRRVRLWLQNDQRMHWEGEARRRMKILDQAEQELLSARLAGHRETLMARQAAVRKARAAVEEAEQKLRNVKRWNRQFDGLAEPLARQVAATREYLDQDVPAAISHLVRMIRSLDEYAHPEAPVEEGR